MIFHNSTEMPTLIENALICLNLKIRNHGLVLVNYSCPAKPCRRQGGEEI